MPMVHEYATALWPLLQAPRMLLMLPALAAALFLLFGVLRALLAAARGGLAEAAVGFLGVAAWAVVLAAALRLPAWGAWLSSGLLAEPLRAAGELAQALGQLNLVLSGF